MIVIIADEDRTYLRCSWAELCDYTGVDWDGCFADLLQL